MEIQYIFAIEICYGANLHYRTVHREQLHEKYFIKKDSKILKFGNISNFFVRALPTEPINPQN